MDRTMTGLLGAVGALVASTPSQAAPSVSPHNVLEAASYADLLQPIPNALETLRAIDAAEADALKVQYYSPYYYRPPPPPPPPYYRYPRYHDGYYQRYYHHHHHRYDGGYYRRW